MAGDKEHHAARIEFHKKRIKDIADAFDNARSASEHLAAEDKTFEIGAEVLTNLERMATAAIKTAAHVESLAKLSAAILEEMQKLSKPVEITMVAAETRTANPNCKVCGGTGMVTNPPSSLFATQSCPACIDKDVIV
jgi:hypothetical protein